MNILPVSKRQIPTMSEIRTVQEMVKERIQTGEMVPVNMPNRDYFSDGVYLREIFMPAGSVVVGKEHRTRHLNIIQSGECIIWTVEGKIHGKAGMVFESLAGVKKVLLMLTDVVYYTIHPTIETDKDKLEGIFITPEEQGVLFPSLENEKLLEDTEQHIRALLEEIH